MPRHARADMVLMLRNAKRMVLAVSKSIFGRYSVRYGLTERRQTMLPGPRREVFGTDGAWHGIIFDCGRRNRLIAALSFQCRSGADGGAVPPVLVGAQDAGKEGCGVSVLIRGVRLGEGGSTYSSMTARSAQARTGSGDPRPGRVVTPPDTCCHPGCRSAPSARSRALVCQGHQKLWFGSAAAAATRCSWPAPTRGRQPLMPAASGTAASRSAWSTCLGAVTIRLARPS